MKSFATWAIIALFMLGLAFRLVFFIYAYPRLPVSSDEAWVGLMALDMLRGHFPVVYWGQSYMGTQESFIDAVLIKLLGVNALSIRIYPLVFSVLFMLVSYLLAARVYNRQVGVIALALLAVPVPYLTMCGVAIPPDNYLATTTLGSVALLLTHQIVFAGRRELRYYAGLGAVLGYAFWLHLLIVSYIGVCVLFLFLRDKLLLFRRELYVFLLAFIVTSLPLWWYNWSNGRTFHDVGRQAGMEDTVDHFLAIWQCTIKYLTGMLVMLYGDNSHSVALPLALAGALGFVSAGLIVLTIILRWKNLWRLCYLSLKNVDGTALLLALATAGVLAFARSTRSGAHDVRYLLPVMSVLPVLLAYGLWRIYRRFKPAFAVLIALMLIAYGWGNAALAKAWNNPEIVGVDLELPDTRPLIEFLKANGIRHAYAHYWISYRLTYETAETIICSEPFNERFLGYPVHFLDVVSRADRVAFICHPTLGFQEEPFESKLKNIGGTYQKTRITPFTVFHDFQPPYGEKALVELPRTDWQVESNCHPELCRLATDGDMATEWTTEAPQTNGMYFGVDFGAEREVCQLRIDLGPSLGDYPRGARVEVSDDSRQWRTVLERGDICGELFRENAQPRYFIKGDYFTMSFAPAKTRYLRIFLTAAHDKCWWTIRELRAFGPEIWHGSNPGYTTWVGTHLRGVRFRPCESGRLGEPSLPVTRIPLVLNRAGNFHPIPAVNVGGQRLHTPMADLRNRLRRGVRSRNSVSP